MLPNPKTNPKPRPNPNRGAIFLGSNCLVATHRPNPKTNPHLDPNPNPNRGAIVGIPIFLYFRNFINLANETIICIYEQILIFLIFKGQYKDRQLLFKTQTIVKGYHKLQELLAFLKILKLQLLQWILVRDIGQLWQKIELCPTKTVRCIWVKRFYITTLFLCPAWDSFLSENILYVITQNGKRKVNISHSLINMEREITDILIFNSQSLCLSVGSSSKHIQKT